MIKKNEGIYMNENDLPKAKEENGKTKPVIQNVAAGASKEVEDQIRQLPKKDNKMEEKRIFADDPESDYIEKDKDNFNGESKVIYEYHEEKESNPIVVIGFFILLVAFILFLPTINKGINKLIGKEIKFGGSNISTNIPPEEKPEDAYYKLDGNSVNAEIGPIRLNNLVTSYNDEEYKINFTINNISDEVYTFDKKYYMSFYSVDENKLSDPEYKPSPIYRALIFSYDPLASKSVSNMSLTINNQVYKKANRFKLEEINTGSYGDVRLDTIDGDYHVLTCRYYNDEMNYYFVNNLLVKVKETYNLDADELNYSKIKSEYENSYNRYNGTPGMVATFVTTDEYFKMINEFNLADVEDKTLSDLHVYRYFKYNEAAKVINFEMAAMGYTCSS